MKLPNVIKYLLIANIVVWILTEMLQMRGVNLNQTLALFYVGHPFFQPFQIVTYMFMHANFMHIFFNMFALWMFGNIMAKTWGEKKFLIFYFICGIGAGITQEVGQALGLIDLNACTVGASGAVFGLLLAFGITFPNEKLFIIPIPFPVKAKYLITFYILIEVLQFFGSGGDGVAHLAHLGGALFGFFLIMFWKKHPSQNINNWKRQAQGYGNSRQQQGNSWFGGGNSTSGSKPTMKVIYGGASRRENDYEYNERKKREAQEIDLILDKIRKNGWDSLTPEEQQIIIDASKN